VTIKQAVSIDNRAERNFLDAFYTREWFVAEVAFSNL
jgi:hypothetical protein